jgi:hypothetical protein
MADKDRDRYCTPRPIARLMYRQFRGLADLDPCHDPTGLTLARTNYDVRRGHDGLALPWRGKVFLNPPYSLPAPWLERAARLWSRGLAETLAIVNVQSGARYWHKWVWKRASAICFLEGRVAFLHGGKPENGNRYDQAVIYYGKDVGRFRRIWGTEGAVVRPPRVSAALLTGRSLRATLAAMDETLHDEMEDTRAPNLMQVLGPAVFYTIYAQVKHLTIEQVMESLLPYLEDFVNGYQYGRSVAEESEDDEVTFDSPPDLGPAPGANGRDTHPPQRRRKKAAKKKAAKRKTAPPKSAAKTAPPPKAKAKPKAPKKPAAGAAAPPQSTRDLDDHVLSLLQAKGAWTPSRDIAPLVRGVNDNQLRKSLARLVTAGLAVSEGATKSKVYMAAS